MKKTIYLSLLCGLALTHPLMACDHEGKDEKTDSSGAKPVQTEVLLSTFDEKGKSDPTPLMTYSSDASNNNATGGAVLSHHVRRKLSLVHTNFKHKPNAWTLQLDPNQFKGDTDTLEAYLTQMAVHSVIDPKHPEFKIRHLIIKDADLIPESSDNLTSEKRDEYIRQRLLHLAKFLLKNFTTIESLDLSNSSIFYLKEGADFFAGYFKACKALKSLNLSHTWLDDKGIVPIVKALRDIPSLKELCLSKNPIGDNGIIAIFDAFKKSTLQSLDMSFANFDMKDTHATNRNEESHMAVHIGKMAYAEVCTFLKEDTGLKILNLQGNFIHETGMSLIISALAENKSILKMYLGKNNLYNALAGKRNFYQLCNVYMHQLEKNNSLLLLNMDEDDLIYRGKLNFLNKRPEDISFEKGKLNLSNISLTHAELKPIFGFLSSSCKPPLVLNLCGNAFNSQEVDLLCDYIIRQRSRMRKISLSNTGISEADFKNISHSIYKSEGGVASIDLSQNNIKFTAEGLMQLIPSGELDEGDTEGAGYLTLGDIRRPLKSEADKSENYNFAKLKLQGNEISLKELKDFFSRLNESKGIELKELTLPNLRLEDLSYELFETIGLFLKDNKTIEKLSLGENDFSKIDLSFSEIHALESNLEILRSNLSKNKTLKELNFGKLDAIQIGKVELFRDGIKKSRKKSITIMHGLVIPTALSKKPTQAMTSANTTVVIGEGVLAEEVGKQSDVSTSGVQHWS